MIEGVRLAEDLLGGEARIGVVPEELPLYERLSGEEHLLFAARMYGLDRAEARRRAAELLDFFSLADERGKLIVDYSQGMRKKLALACAPRARAVGALPRRAAQRDRPRLGPRRQRPAAAARPRAG